MLNILADEVVVYTIDDVVECDSVIVYKVPKEYSEDELFIAHWARNQIEPLPACRSDKYEVLAAISITKDLESGSLRAVGATIGGITYAIV